MMLESGTKNNQPNDRGIRDLKNILDGERFTDAYNKNIFITFR